ncbi:hypothetical protein TNCV_1585341, partial [Trichonephila clavipes]
HDIRVVRVMTSDVLVQPHFRFFSPLNALRVEQWSSD